MLEVGLDLSKAKPQMLIQNIVKDADLLITMGCGDACPNIPGLRCYDWTLEDPHGLPVERVREIRDEIKRRVDDLLFDLRIFCNPF